VGPSAGLAGSKVVGFGAWNQVGIHALKEAYATFDLVRRRMRMNKMITANTISRTVRNEDGKTAK
jgi:hypothetical protein